MKRMPSGIARAGESAGCHEAKAISSSPSVQPMSYQAGAQVPATV